MVFYCGKLEVWRWCTKDIRRFTWRSRPVLDRCEIGSAGRFRDGEKGKMGGKPRFLVSQRNEYETKRAGQFKSMLRNRGCCHGCRGRGKARRLFHL